MLLVHTLSSLICHARAMRLSVSVSSMFSRFHRSILHVSFLLIAHFFLLSASSAYTNTPKAQLLQTAQPNFSSSNIVVNASPIGETFAKMPQMTTQSSLSDLRSMQSAEALEKIRKAIVKVTANISVSPMSQGSTLSGTGFIVDKKAGYIITNAHVIGRSSIGSYFITFNNGREAEVKVVYYDVWQDYAILKVAEQDKDLLKNLEELSFAKEKLNLYDAVFVVNNSEGQDFSFHTGNVSNLYAIHGAMPQMSYVINLNTAGGSSGSPILNEKLEIVAVLYGKSQSYVHALHIDYIIKTFESVRKSQMPVRKHIGVLTSNYSLDSAMRHRNFPRDVVAQYVADCPESRNYGIMIDNIIPNTPNIDELEVGDIIWEVDNQKIDGNLLKMDMLMDAKQDNNIEVTIYRKGVKIKKKLKLYNINDNRIDDFINFNGGFFFIADDYVSSVTSIPKGHLAVVFAEWGSALSSLNKGTTSIRIEPYMLGDYPISNLANLKYAIPQVAKQRFTSLRYKTHSIYWKEYLEAFYTASDGITDITLDDTAKSVKGYKYNPKTFEWTTYDIK